MMYDNNAGGDLSASNGPSRLDRRAQVTLDSIGEGVVRTDCAGVVEYLNPVAEQITGWPLAQAQGQPLGRVLPLLEEDSGRAVADPVRRCMRHRRAIRVSGRLVSLDHAIQHQYAIDATCAPIYDTTGAATGAVLVFHDVTKLHRLARQLSHQATHDALTGLVNRTEFESRVERALQRAWHDGKQAVLCYLDLDQFKVVNDTCGHQAGDELLKQLSARMLEQLRDSDTLARLGGDEFGILFEGCPLHKAQAIAEQLRGVVEQFRLFWEGKTFRVGVSIGIVPITRETTGLTELLGAADSACYVAKEQGRNRVHVYQGNHQGLPQHGRIRWMQRIRSALDEDRFEIFLQPIVATRDPTRVRLHGEVLLRMISERPGAGERLVAPSAFIPAAERYHLMPAIDRWVLRSTLHMLMDAEPAQRPAICAINLAGQSLSELLDEVLELLGRTGIPASSLCFEITEMAVISHPEAAKQFIRELRSRGCRFSLDDFGTALGTLTHIKDLPIDFLKLDGSLTRNIVSDRVGRAMVHAIQQIAEVMGIETIAEHVETAEAYSVLREIGVDHCQGHVIQAPVPLRELLDGGRSDRARPPSRRSADARARRAPQEDSMEEKAAGGTPVTGPVR
jgi:diguanylate cyclase (GGDEF)-like protein